MNDHMNMRYVLGARVRSLQILNIRSRLLRFNQRQILWINIIMDGPPAQSLGVEPVDGAIVKMPPRKAGDPVISRRLMSRVLSSGALIVIGTLWVFSLGIFQVRHIPKVLFTSYFAKYRYTRTKARSTRRLFSSPERGTSSVCSRQTMVV